MRKLYAILVVAAALSCVTNQSMAGDTGSRNIIDFGCHTGNSICYATIDGAPVGDEFGCSSSSVRWNADESPSGKRLFAIIQGAFLSGTRVQFFITGCLSTYPTFSYASATK